MYTFMLRTYELLYMLGYAMYVKRLAALHNSEKLERDVSVGVKQWLKHPEQIVFVYTYVYRFVFNIHIQICMVTSHL